MNNSGFSKAMENVKNPRDIRVVTTDKRRSILTSEPKYHSTKYISKDLVIMEIKKVEVKWQTLMHEFWYDYIKPKYGNK